MAKTLISPGVSISVTDESFYGSGAQGTTPLIVIATAANKTAASGIGTAPYTTPAYSEKLYLATSQRDLLAKFGNPVFTTVEGTAVHGSELSEYGLHAAYSFLGINNRCFVLRADIDTSQLAASITPPVAPPFNGTYWLDLSTTQWGLFRSNGSAITGSAWVAQSVLVPTASQVDPSTFVPLVGFGTNGNYCVVPWTANNLFFEKIGGVWYQIGSTIWKQMHTTVVTSIANPATIATGNAITINTVTATFNGAPNSLTTMAAVINAAMAASHPSVVASVANNALVITETNGAPLILTNVTGTPLLTFGFVTTGVSTITIPGISVTRNSNATWPAGTSAGSLWVKGNPANNGAKWSIKYYNSATGFVTVTAPFAPFDSTKSDGDITKDTSATVVLGTPSTGALYVAYDPATGVQQIRRYSSAGWSQLQEVMPGAIFEPLEYEASFVAPSNTPADGTLWYDATPSVDIMVGDGEQWLGYRRMYPSTDSFGVILSGSAPTAQVGGHPVTSGGSTTMVYTLVDNDLWIDTSDLEHYPALYTWSTSTFRWNAIDKTDHTSPFGIVFSDARANSGPTFTGIANASAYAYNSAQTADLALSDYVDPDVNLVSPANSHPAGMLLFNTRFSTGNVKVWQSQYLKAGGADPNTDFTVTTYQAGNPNVTFPVVSSAGRWVSASGNDPVTGAAYMLRKAQRTMIVRKLTEAVVTNQDIRSELAYFNLMAAPGYPELLPELESLNIDQKEVSFIVSDTPIRLKSDATSLANWASNAANVAADGEDGLVTAYDYAATYYPWGLGTDNAGNQVMIPASTIALRTMAYNDQVAYQWFAPAGFQRGLVTNATSVGYLSPDGTYQPVILNQGQRDTLYSHKINPIAYIPSRGLVVYGQKTLAPLSSALDRINVARLINYIRYNLDIIVKPYLFEQNDAATQKAAKNTVERFFNSLVGLRALSDYAVQCDHTNNTPDRVARNELWIDCGITPIKSVEMIYIPIRIQNSSSVNINS